LCETGSGRAVRHFRRGPQTARGAVDRGGRRRGRGPPTARSWPVCWFGQNRALVPRRGRSAVSALIARSPFGIEVTRPRARAAPAPGGWPTPREDAARMNRDHQSSTLIVDDLDLPRPTLLCYPAVVDAVESIRVRYKVLSEQAHGSGACGVLMLQSTLQVDQAVDPRCPRSP
jgi:hypothetical protein